MKNLIKKIKTLKILKKTINLEIYKKQKINKKYYFLFWKINSIFNSNLSIEKIIEMEISFWSNFNKQMLMQKLHEIFKNTENFLFSENSLKSFTNFIWLKLNNKVYDIETEWIMIKEFNNFIDTFKLEITNFNQYIMKILRLFN